jgi:hypothetical protein
MPQLVTLPSTASIEEVCEVIRRDGGVIVEDMLSSELVDQFMADIQPYLDRTPYGEAGFTGTRTRRTSALMAKSLHSAELLTLVGGGQYQVTSHDEAPPDTDLLSCPRWRLVGACDEPAGRRGGQRHYQPA